MTMFATHRLSAHLTTRRSLLGMGAAAAGVLALPSTIRATRQATPVAPSPDDIVAIAESVMADLDLRATILRVAIDGDEVVTAALGESITGVPATTDMRFRNGAVAISLISTLMLTLVDDGAFGLDDPIDTWLPDLPETDAATFRMLANMTGRLSRPRAEHRFRQRRAR